MGDHAPCDNLAITSWEQRYSTVLPHEIRDFYLATDGFKLTWNFNHGSGRALELELVPIAEFNVSRFTDDL